MSASSWRRSILQALAVEPLEAEDVARQALLRIEPPALREEAHLSLGKSETLHPLDALRVELSLDPREMAGTVEASFQLSAGNSEDPGEQGSDAVGVFDLRGNSVQRFNFDAHGQFPARAIQDRSAPRLEKDHPLMLPLRLLGQLRAAEHHHREEAERHQDVK